MFLYIDVFFEAFFEIQFAANWRALSYQGSRRRRWYRLRPWQMTTSGQKCNKRSRERSAPESRQLIHQAEHKPQRCTCAPCTGRSRGRWWMQRKVCSDRWLSVLQAAPGDLRMSYHPREVIKKDKTLNADEPRYRGRDAKSRWREISKYDCTSREK